MAGKMLAVVPPLQVIEDACNMDDCVELVSEGGDVFHFQPLFERVEDFCWVGCCILDPNNDVVMAILHLRDEQHPLGPCKTLFIGPDFLTALRRQTCIML